MPFDLDKLGEVLGALFIGSSTLLVAAEGLSVAGVRRVRADSAGS